MGRNEHSTTYQVFCRIDLFGLTHERIAALHPLVTVRIGGVTSITIADHIYQVASQADEPAALPLEIQWKRRVGKTLAYSAFKALVVIANASHG